MKMMENEITFWSLCQSLAAKVFNVIGFILRSCKVNTIEDYTCLECTSQVWNSSCISHKERIKKVQNLLLLYLDFQGYPLQSKGVSWTRRLTERFATLFIDYIIAYMCVFPFSSDGSVWVQAFGPDTAGSALQAALSRLTRLATLRLHAPIALKIHSEPALFLQVIYYPQYFPNIDGLNPHVDVLYSF